MRWTLTIFCALQLSAIAFSQTPVIADHKVATLSALQSIPATYINAAKANLRIAYEHASHGSQITEGMAGLFAWKGSTYAFAKGGGSGILDYRDHDIEGWADLGNLWEPDEVDFEAWEGVTRTYLAKNPDVNVIMWSWCTELSYDAVPADVNTYLSLMSGLEEDFPNVRFIYMTGHVDGRPPNTNLYIHNAMIRDYCIANNKILYDFGDIESYDPDGNFYANKRVTDCCNYDYDGSGETETDGGDPGIPTGGDRNWALDWQASHTKNVDWFDCEASHTYPLNANMKAYAAWWLWARLAGWDGSTTSIPVTGISVTGAGGATTITTDNGTLQLSAAVSPANATNKTVTWSVTNGTGQATISSTGLVTAVANGTVTAKATANDGSGVSGTLTITISNQVIPVTGISVTGAGGATTITTDNGTLQLSAAVSPSDATNKTVTWSITNGTGQATIGSTGLVTAVANGTVTAKATANDGTGIYGTLTIIISNQVIPVTGVTVTGAGGATTITTDKGTLQLTAAVVPTNATNNTVRWSVINGTGQATISSTGLVTAVANGTVTARATANDGTGIYGTLTITISNQVIPVTGVTVTGAGGATTITTDNGTLQLSAAVSPSNATNKTVTWSVTNGTGQATISSAGLVTAVANGTVTARATANDGTGIYGTLTITISNQVVPVSSISVAGAGGASIITSLGGTLQLSASVLPANVTNNTVRWSVTNGTGQATISSAGLVTAVANGTVTARATANDGTGIYGTLTITISNQVIPVTGVTVSGAGGATAITTDKGTLQLSAAVLPTNATNNTVRWSVSNGTGQATISSAGLVTAVANGTVTARATANDGTGVYGTLTITISNQVIPVTGVTVSGAGGVTAITTDKGTLQLSAAVLPTNATNNTVRWSVSNGTGQATISSTGLLTAVANGTVTARATANDGTGIYGTLTITISNQIIHVTGVTVTGAGGVTTITTDKGTLQLTAAIVPTNATNNTVRWSVTNGTGQATISSAGLVTAVANGTVTARATANDGTGIYGTLTISISNQVVPVSSISVNGAGGSSIITSLGGTLQLSASVLPADATNKAIVWSITNGTGQATINTSGLVTAVANGSVIARATATDGSGIYGTLNITISTQMIAVSSITVSGAGGVNTLAIHEGTLQLSAAVLPSDVTDRTVTWSVINGTGKATISSTGLVTAIANGIVTARATANDGSGIYGTLAITISNQIVKVTSVTVAGEGGTQIISTNGGTLQLSATVLPTDATDRTITWSVTSGTGQAAIDDSGLLTASANGTVTAKATANDGSGISGILEITISNQLIPVSEIHIASEEGITTINKEAGTLQLHASVFPNNATDTTITWTIFNITGQATISSAGLVTAVADGVVMAIAAANDGSGVKDSLEIWVAEQAILIEVINVVPSEKEMPIIKEKSGNLQMEAEIIPSEASIEIIDWAVENLSGKAIVDNKGLVTAVANGSVKVIAKAKDGSNKSGFCMVAITNQAEITGIRENGNASFLVSQSMGKLKIHPVDKDLEFDYCSLYSIHGVLLKREKVNDDSIEMDVSSYPPGIYIISLSNDQQAFPVKVAIR